MTLGKTLVRVIRYLLSIKKVPKKDTKTLIFYSKKVVFGTFLVRKGYQNDNFLFKKGRFWDLFGSKCKKKVPHRLCVRFRSLFDTKKSRKRPFLNKKRSFWYLFLVPFLCSKGSE